MRHTIDPAAGWEQLVASQPAPTRELFDSLFKAGDRDKIITATLPLIRQYNAKTPLNIREDVEAFAVMKVVEAVDRLLQQPNTNPGSYIIGVIRGAIHAARFGESVEAQQCSPSTQRIYRPKERDTDAECDALIRQLQQQGCSERMTDSELALRGFDRSRVMRLEGEWPHKKARGEDGHFTGERVPMEFGAPDPSNDDWGHLVELFEAGVIDDSEMQLLDAKLQGFTNAECASIFSAHVSTITARLTRIAQKIQDHQETDT